jgi:hypothetical protein|tara:strand:+ start:8831 stop:9001 length:171 start_codon:yes stop_codon:yes gene_type:complete
MSDLKHREALALLSQTINATTSLMKEKGEGFDLLCDAIGCMMESQSLLIKCIQERK